MARLRSEITKKLAEEQSNLDTALSKEAATKVTLEKLSVKVADLHLKVADLEQELKGIDHNVRFSER